VPGGHGKFDFALFKPPFWLQCVAVGFVLAAGLLNGLARRRLSENWFPGVGRRPKQTITMTGPYSYVRHPMYSSYLLYAIGFILASGGLIVTLLIAAACINYIRRIKHEEQLLIEVRAQQYRNYIGTTGKLFPKFSTLRTKWRARFGEDPHTP
jgi:protein-S-isoprenylcysteine O-methyltransferase Ste14